MLLADAAHQAPPLLPLLIAAGVMAAIIGVACWLAWRDANSTPSGDF